MLLIIYDFVARFVAIIEIPNKYYALPVILILIGINWYRYEHKNKFIELNERWSTEPKRTKRIRGIIVILLIIGSILIPMLIGYLRHNLGMNV